MSEWVRRLLGVTIVAGALEFLLPEGKIRSFSRMILGLVLVFTMASPLLSFRLEQPSLLPAAAGARRSEEREDLLLRAFDLRLRQEITELLQKRGYVCTEAKAHWEQAGTLEQVEVELEGGPGQTKELAAAIAKHLDLEPADVSVVLEGRE